MPRATFRSVVDLGDQGGGAGQVAGGLAGGGPAGAEGTQPSGGDGGTPALIDGVYLSMMTPQSADGRPLVMVFTDGLDPTSWLRADDLINATKRAGAVVYTVATGPARQWQFMKDLAAATGGRAIALDSAKDLRAEFAKILTEFRSRYVLSFNPTGVSDTGYHTLTVRSKRSGIAMKARPGYTAGAVR